MIVREGTPAQLTGGPRSRRRSGTRATVKTVVERTAEPTRRLHELTEAALADGGELEGLEVRRPTLEDVYLELTAE